MSLWLFDVEVEVGPAYDRGLFSLDRPTSGTRVYGDQLEVVGWAFGVDGSATAVELDVYGHGKTRVMSDQTRDDVAAAYPQFPHAGRSGFALLASVPRTPRTEVGVFVVRDDERIGLATIRLVGGVRERWSGADAPLVSVVIPCYNQGRFLEEAIDSVRRQTYPRVEVIVVDDGSADDTSAVAASLGVRCIRQENRGQAGARNRGAAEAGGEYLVFLDADDRLLPHGVEANVDGFAELPEAALVCGWYRCVMSADEPLPYPVNMVRNERNEVVELIPPPAPPEGDLYKALLEFSYSIVCPASVMYRRDVFNAIGGFDGSNLGSEDHDLYLRMAREHPMFVHDVPIAEYRQHLGNFSRDPVRMLESGLGVLRAQRAWVRRDDVLRAAWKRGVDNRRALYGGRVARELRGALGDRDWHTAGSDAWVLARKYPSGLAQAIAGSRRVPRITRVLARPHPADRFRGYPRTVRVLLGQTPHEVRGSRGELAGHLAGLEAFGSSEVEQVETLGAGAEQQVVGDGGAREIGGPPQQGGEARDRLEEWNARVEDQVRVLAGLEKRLAATEASGSSAGAGASPQRSPAPPWRRSKEAGPGGVLGGTHVTLRAHSEAGPPRLAVVMSAYNQERYVADAIESVFAQRTEFPIQLIITDDASTDATPEIIESFRAKRPDLITVIRSQRNGWYFANVLRALAFTKTDFFTLLDADDYWTDENYLQRGVDFLESHPEFVIYSAVVVRAGLDGSRRFYPEDAGDQEFCFEDFLQDRVLLTSTPATMFRNVVFKSGVPAVFAEMLATNEQYSFAGDPERYMIHLEKGKARFENRDVAVYRMTGDGLWTGLDELEQSLWQAWSRLDHWKYFGYRYPEFFLAWALTASTRCLEIMHDVASGIRPDIVITPQQLAELRHVVDECRLQLASLLGAGAEQGVSGGWRAPVVGGPRQQGGEALDWVEEWNARVEAQVRALAGLEERLGVTEASGPGAGTDASPRRSPAPPWRRSEQRVPASVQPGGVLAGTHVTLRAHSEAGPPRLAVVMSTYNQERYVADAIESVFAQRTEFPIQLIITDDASTDATLEIVESFRARRPELVTVIRSESNAWYFANVMRALALTKTDFFTLLDADDYWTDENYLQRGVDFLESHPEFVIYSANCLSENVDGSRAPFIAEDVPDQDFTFEDFLQYRALFSQTTGTIFRNVFFKSGVPSVFADMIGTHKQYSFACDDDRYWIHLEKGKARLQNRAVGVYRITGAGVYTGLSELEKSLWEARRRLDHWRYFGYRHPEFFLIGAVTAGDTCLEIMHDVASGTDTDTVITAGQMADLRRVVEECRAHFTSLAESRRL